MKLLLLAALAFTAPALLLLLAGAGWTWLYLAPLGLAGIAAFVNSRPPPRTQ
jgi:hypothetical protein